MLAAASQDDVREWLRCNWSNDFLAADPAVVRSLLPFIDLAHSSNRAALVLYAVDHDWAEVLEWADPACGFTHAFWRDAFERARKASSVQCIAWLLANKGDIVAPGAKDGLEL